MTDEEFNERMDKLAARHEALNRSFEQRAIETAKRDSELASETAARDRELEAIGAQLASLNTEIEALVAKQR
jgi:prefoldin subunit 5